MRSDKSSAAHLIKDLIRAGAVLLEKVAGMFVYILSQRNKSKGRMKKRAWKGWPLRQWSSENRAGIRWQNWARQSYQRQFEGVK